MNEVKIRKFLNFYKKILVKHINPESSLTLNVHRGVPLSFSNIL